MSIAFESKQWLDSRIYELERELSQTLRLVEYDRERLIRYVRSLEDAVSRLRRFFRRDGHGVIAEKIAEDFMERWDYAGCNQKRKAMDRAFIVDAIQKAFLAGACATAIRSWRPMPPAPEETAHTNTTTTAG